MDWVILFHIYMVYIYIHGIYIYVNMVYIVYMVWYGDLGSAWVFRFAVPSTKDWKSCICFIKLLAISSIFFICEQIH